MTPDMTPDDVREIRFRRPAIGRRGYAEPEVDLLLDAVEATLRDPSTPRITRAEVQAIGFHRPRFGQRGYDEGEVDAFLDAAVQALPY